MSFEVEGKLYKKFDTEQKTATFQAREFILEIEEGNYPQKIKFQLVQDRCEMMDQYEPGSRLKVYFDLRGREWNERFFTNLNAWRIESMEDISAENAPGAAPPSSGSNLTDKEPDMDPFEGDSKEDNNFDDLPF